MKHERAHILRSAPYFPVHDVAAAVRHYELILGFEVEYLPVDQPTPFAIVRRDGFALMLRLVDASATIVPIEKQGGTWDVFFWTDDADALCSEMRSRGADIAYGPIIQSRYGMKEFAVRDPSGHVLGFGQDWPG